MHPSQVAAVHALSVVTREDYADATDILRAGTGGGATSSS
jgi:citrate lyase beta subunit